MFGVRGLEGLSSHVKKDKLLFDKFDCRTTQGLLTGIVGMFLENHKEIDVKGVVYGDISRTDGKVQTYLQLVVDEGLEGFDEGAVCKLPDFGDRTLVMDTIIAWMRREEEDYKKGAAELGGQLMYDLSLDWSDNVPVNIRTITVGEDNA